MLLYVCSTVCIFYSYLIFHLFFIFQKEIIINAPVNRSTERRKCRFWRRRRRNAAASSATSGNKRSRSRSRISRPSKQRSTKSRWSQCEFVKSEFGDGRAERKGKTQEERTSEEDAGTDRGPEAAAEASQWGTEGFAFEDDGDRVNRDSFEICGQSIIGRQATGVSGR